MFDVLQSLSGWLTTLFVLTSMVNVGLTQHPRKILSHLKDWQYLLRMLVANFFVVPGIMLLAVIVFGVGAPFAHALLLFACAAGAPLLIKLTAQSDNEISAGATLQMVFTVGVLPLLLPQLIEGVEVDPLAIARPLLLQMILPLVVGMILHVFLGKVAAAVQPIVAKLSNIALYALLGATVVGYLPDMFDLQLWSAILVGVLVLLIAFYTGYGTGQGDSQMSQLGALGTAQRNTAAAMITAQGFEDPRVFVTIAVLNTLMMFVLLALATRLGNGASVALLEPLEADMPGGRQRPYSTR